LSKGVLSLDLLGTGLLTLIRTSCQLGSLKIPLSSGSIDGTTQLGTIHENGDLIVFHFSESTEKSNGGPICTLPQAKHTPVESGEHGDVARKHPQLTGGAGKDYLIDRTVKDALIRS
jgi:hypothetical protein